MGQRPEKRGWDEFWQILQEESWDGARKGDVFLEFLDIMFCSLTRGKVEYDKRKMFRTNREGKIGLLSRAIRALGEAMEREPFRDLLGRVYQENSAGSDRQARGSFYSPDSIAGLMTALTFDIEEMKEKIGRGESVSVNDPACGSGRMILAAAGLLGDMRSGLRVSCTDIDLTACKIAYVNFSLCGIPAVVSHGDALKMKCWQSWRTPALVAQLAIEKETRQMRMFAEMLCRNARKNGPAEG